MNDADEFLERVDRQLWAVKLTPRLTDDDVVYVCVIPGGKMVHRTGPSWMNYQCAWQAYVRYLDGNWKHVYAAELIPQFNMVPA